MRVRSFKTLAFFGSLVRDNVCRGPLAFDCVTSTFNVLQHTWTHKPKWNGRLSDVIQGLTVKLEQQHAMHAAATSANVYSFHTSTSFRASLKIGMQTQLGLPPLTIQFTGVVIVVSCSTQRWPFLVSSSWELRHVAQNFARISLRLHSG